MKVLPKYYLNIGLDNSDNYPDRQVSQIVRTSMVFDAIMEYGFVYECGNMAISTTEPTMCLVLRDVGTPDTLHERLHNMAVYLGQDCIAVRDETGHGELFGEHPWGAFDSSLFIQPKE